ncbi:MAG: hypothetical protein IKM85_01375 [Bacteroidales bacterium]|nr:hypothetical protein [Bacteroidales bacterium]
MRKYSTLLLSIIFLTVFSGCGSMLRTSVNNTIRNSINNSTAFSEKYVVNSIPKTYNEFEAMYYELAKTPDGCVVLELLAMEMYRTNNSAGVRALQLVNTETNYNTMMRRLPEIFREGDSYARPYLVASYMEGAEPENGYNPDKPYVIRVQPNRGQPSQYSEMMQGTTYPMKVYCYGADTHWRPVTVIMLDGDEYYKMHECSSVTLQCKEIKRTQTFNGLE